MSEQTLRDRWPTVVAIINAIGTDISKTEALDAIEKELVGLLANGAPVTARFTVQPPAWKQDGIPPAETTHACLYTHVRPCKEDHPTNTDQWCGYCRGTGAGLVTLQRSRKTEQGR